MYGLTDDYQIALTSLQTNLTAVYAQREECKKQLRITRAWMLQADQLLAQAGFQPDCSIRHALACGLPAEDRLMCMHQNYGPCKECEKERAALRCEPRDV